MKVNREKVFFHWYAGGAGKGDFDSDTVLINGAVSQIPEPSTFALVGVGVVVASVSRKRRL